MSRDQVTDGGRLSLSPLGPGTNLGQYQLIRELGRGGMGAVYLARDTRLGRRVAIKFLAQQGKKLSDRFLSEARVTARCKHDNIVDIYDVGETQGYSYMVLEYLQGVTLRRWLRDRWQSSESQEEQRVSSILAVELIAPVVRALAHAHAQGLVHRDLKPENIMMTEDGSIKVLDFGIAKVLDRVFGTGGLSLVPGHEVSGRWSENPVQTHESMFMGTLPYMSPEQWGTGDIDARTDIWAVGIMLWELCIGRHPLDPLTDERLHSIRDVAIAMPSLVVKRSQLGTLAGIVDRCLRKRLDERMPSARALLAELEPLLPGHRQRSRVSSKEVDNPYVGLAAFQSADSERFFGRDRDIGSLIARLRNHRLVTVVGSSGAGKSSLIRAGVVPALERSGQSWESLITRPGRQPLSALADVLASITRSEPQTPDPLIVGSVLEAGSHVAFIKALRSRPGYLGAVLRTRAHKSHGRILLFVDQFEELYTLCANKDEREAFVRCLEGVADDASSPLRVVLAVRSDFIDRVAEDRVFTSEILRGMTLLAPLSRERLREALTEPLTVAGYAFESDSLVECMLDTLEAARCPLPLLQFTASCLWEMRDLQRKCIDQRSYDDLGGIEGAFANHADAVLTGMSRAEQRLARMVFTDLVSDEKTRALVSMDELRANVRGSRASETVGNIGQMLEDIVNQLASARLISKETDSEQGVTVQLIHESLIEHWPKLVRWLAENEDVAQLHARLRAAARQWDRQGRSEDLLWRGRAAEEAERWMRREDSALAKLGARDEAYLRAVVGLHQRWRRWLRTLQVGGSALALSIAVAVSLLAMRASHQAREAEGQRVIAEQSAVQARNIGRIAIARENRLDPTLVVALVREMEPSDPLPRGWRALVRRAMVQDIAEQVFEHPKEAISARFSPDGTRIVTTSADHIVRVWNLGENESSISLDGHRDYVFTAVFSPDGKRIVTASFDDTARVWNADGTGTPIVLRGHKGNVFAAAFSPDGMRIVTASSDATAWIWSADGTGEPIVLRGHQRGVSSAAFSPDGARIVTTSFDNTARVWAADGNGTAVVLRGHDESVYWGAFGPDGRRVVTASYDKTARIWRADGTGNPIVLRGHEDSLSMAMFTPDGNRIVTASQDGTVRVWNAHAGGRSIRVWRVGEPVNSATVSPDGARLLTASDDNTARIWTVSKINGPVRLLGHNGPIGSALYSPDGTRIATASQDGTVRVWNANDTETPMVLRGHEGPVYSAVFTADSTRIVSASADDTVRLWNADGTGESTVLPGHHMPVSSAAPSPDGARIVTTSRDTAARVWNVDGSGTLVILEGHEESVHSAVFSPDGTKILTSSHDKTARLWNSDGRGEPIVLRGHLAGVNGAVFSRDGSLIITVSNDETARIWDVGQLVAGAKNPFIELRGHQSGLAPSGSRSGGIAFNADMSRVVTIASDKTLRIWNVNGIGEPVVLPMPDIDPWAISFSPDGARIITTFHSERDEFTEKMTYWSTIWPAFNRLSGLDDSELWTATRYCPSIELRKQLLSITEERAASQLRACQAHVTAVWNAEVL